MVSINVSKPNLLLSRQTYEFFINKCTEKDEMPYYNQILKQYECYPLLSQGPCDPGYWLILDKDQPNKAVCAEELCLEKDFEDYEDNPIVYYNGCKNKYDILYDDICPYGQELMTNAFGEGMLIKRQRDYNFKHFRYRNFGIVPE